MGTKTITILVAYVAGQITQLVVHGMCLNFNMWSNRQIPFCMAAGFVIFFAILAGALISRSGGKEKPSHEKTYKEYAEVPEENIDEVVNPFSGAFKK